LVHDQKQVSIVETQRGKILKKRENFNRFYQKFGMVGLVEEHKRVGKLLLFITSIIKKIKKNS
jgi:hypothetical protein